MLKLPIIGALLGVVALGIIAGAVLMNRKNIPPTPNSQNSITLDQVNEDSAPKSLRGLMQMASNQMCTFDDQAGNEGTVYVGNGKMRGDFTSVVLENSTATHMVSDNENIYMWFDEGTEGFKVSLAEIEKFSDFGEDGQKTVDLDQEVNLNCNSWTVDNSKFTLPTIEFKDFSSMLMPSPVSEEQQEAQCGACDSLPAESQAQCKQLLGC